MLNSISRPHERVSIPSYPVLISCFVFVVCVLLYYDFHFLYCSNRVQVSENLNSIRTQISSVINFAADRDELMEDSVRREYEERVKLMAYTAAENPTLVKDMDSLETLAEKSKVDEIHLFDETGRIYMSNIPEYIGMTMKSGEQISFFLPLLDDHRLSLCQGITENTASGKEFVYAMSWVSDSVGFIQIGVSAESLMSEKKEMGIRSILENSLIPSSTKVLIFDENKAISYCSDPSLIEKGASGLSQTVAARKCKLNSGRYYYVMSDEGNYSICVLIPTADADADVLYSIGILSAVAFLIAVLGAALLCRLVLEIKREEKDVLQSNEEKLHAVRSELGILKSIGSDYTDVMLLDFKSEDGNIQIIKAEDDYFAYGGPSMIYTEFIDRYTENIVLYKDSVFFFENTRKENILNRLSGGCTEYAFNYHVSLGGKEHDYQIKYVKVSGEEDFYVVALKNIDAIIKDQNRAAMIKEKASRDDLTGLYNRYAYEDDMDGFDVYIPNNFIYVSMDINELKTVNDTMGYEAGDELLVGAVSCIYKCFSPYGKIYRIGGDEFAAMIYASRDELSDILKDFGDTTSMWHSLRISDLTVSIGTASYEEFPDCTVTFLASKARDRMLKDKADYYASHGLDRKRRKVAYDSLCRLYGKIVKGSLTSDIFNIVQIETDEFIENRVSEIRKLSDWFSYLNSDGGIHLLDRKKFSEKTDLEYLKNYFDSGNKAFEIHYRRNAGEKYQETVMEIIPAPEYSAKNQLIFIFTKDVGRTKYESGLEECEKLKLIHKEEAERLIHEGIEKEYFKMMYQPQYTIDRNLRGFESLVRLVLPDGKVISPGMFIPEAEESDLIMKVDEYVITHVIEEARALLNIRPDVIFGVNVSARTISKKGFADSLLSELSASNVPPGNFGVEITEYSYAQDSAAAKENIIRLRNAGIEISLDDFGTGYTSLEQLLKNPAALLKIDKSLVDDIDSDSRKNQMIKAIIDIAHMMGSHVIAEGVEKEEQLAILRQYGCDYIQGYLWGRPAPIEEILKY